MNIDFRPEISRSEMIEIRQKARSKGFFIQEGAWNLNLISQLDGVTYYETPSWQDMKDYLEEDSTGTIVHFCE